MRSVEELVKEIINKEVPHLTCSIHDMDMDGSLGEYGVDSFSFVRIIVSLEIEAEVEFEDEVLAMDSLISINDFINYITKKLKEKNTSFLI